MTPARKWKYHDRLSELWEAGRQKYLKEQAEREAQDA